MAEVLIAAGEASGDVHGASLVAALAAEVPAVHVQGIGGRRMRSAGASLIEDVDQMAVMGFVEVLRQIPHHYALLRRLDALFASGKIGLFVPIDYPGFNLRAAALARRHGVPVLYYITPQVWAWGANRLPKMARLITRAAVILPFEEQLLRAHHIDATFVGHPLLDRAAKMPSKEAARAALGFAPRDRVLALFPGSRRQELARHLEPFVEVGRRLQRGEPGLQVVVAATTEVPLPAGSCPFPIVTDESFTVLRAADAALCKSGTTTLEAAVAGCPFVIGYRTSAWTYAMAKRAVRIPHIGLVNVVGGRAVVPEFVQGALEPEAVANALRGLLDPASEGRARQVEGLGEVRAMLGQPGAAARVAAMARALLP